MTARQIHTNNLAGWIQTYCIQLSEILFYACANISLHSSSIITQILKNVLVVGPYYNLQIAMGVTGTFYFIARKYISS